MASKGGRVPESYEPGDLNFHYNRDEREAMLSEETKKYLTRSKKRFTLNRRNMIILIDIVVIVLITMIFVPLGLSGRSSTRVDNFITTLRAYEYNGRILVSLKVESGKDNPDEAGIVSVIFSIEDGEETFDSVDLLPSEAAEPRIFRAEFPASGNEKKQALAEVEINGKTRKLSATVKVE